MSPKPAKRPISKRPATEREVWQKITQRGKTLFVIRFTLILGCLLMIPALPIHYYLSKQHATGLELAGTAAVCLCLGYIAGSLLWQRGQAILRKPYRAPKYRP